MIVLDEPTRANFLAVVVHRMARSPRRALPRGSFLIAADGMKARLIVDDRPRVVSGDGQAETTIEATLGTLLTCMGPDLSLRFLITSRIRVRGNRWKTLLLFRALRCSSTS